MREDICLKDFPFTYSNVGSFFVIVIGFQIGLNIDLRTGLLLFSNHRKKSCLSSRDSQKIASVGK